MTSKIIIRRLTAIIAVLFITATVSSAQVIFTGNEAAFMAQNPGLDEQEFNFRILAPDEILGCDVPVTEFSNGPCFNPGEILPHLLIADNPAGGLLMVGPFHASNLNPNNVLTPDGSVQSLDVFFNNNNSAVGLDVGCLFDFGAQAPCTGDSLDINVYGENGDLIGTDTVAVDSTFTTFVGINSTNQAISRVNVAPANDQIISFTGVDRILFNSNIIQNVPTLSEWGLIAMASILGIVGFMVIRRRKVTA